MRQRRAVSRPSRRHLKPSFFSCGTTSVRIGCGGRYLLTRLAVWPARAADRVQTLALVVYCNQEAKHTAHVFDNLLRRGRTSLRANDIERRPPAVLGTALPLPSMWFTKPGSSQKEPRAHPTACRR